LLRAAATALSAQLRSYDLVVRVGGDEFVCALPGMSVEEAARRLSLARDDLAAGPLSGSFSCGFAELRADDDVDDLIARADAALYAVRELGRAPA
jgi:diguanylate cyclase (GGDEF)-like protein